MKTIKIKADVVLVPNVLGKDSCNGCIFRYDFGNCEYVNTINPCGEFVYILENTNMKEKVL